MHIHYVDALPGCKECGGKGTISHGANWLPCPVCVLPYFPATSVENPCPVCKGYGKRLWYFVDGNTWTWTTDETRARGVFGGVWICPICDGAGTAVAAVTNTLEGTTRRYRSQRG